MQLPEFIPFEGSQTLSLRQIDQLNGLAKGATFRLFKAHRERLQEGQDYFHLSADKHGELIEQLKVSGQVYATSVHLLLFTRQGYERLQALAKVDATSG